MKIPFEQNILKNKNLVEEILRILMSYVIERNSNGEGKTILEVIFFFDENSCLIF